MTAAYLDTQPELLDKWSRMNPLGRIGRPDEMRGVVAWLASDASSFCTGSECVCPLIGAATRMLIGWQHYREWWPSRVVREGSHVYTMYIMCPKWERSRSAQQNDCGWSKMRRQTQLDHGLFKALLAAPRSRPAN